MNMFLDPHFWELKTSAELWVLVGLIIFLAIAVLAGAPRMAAKALDGKAAKIQSELDEAARLRAEADARRIETEAKAKLEEALTRRQALAERRIAQAEAQATTDVKAAAADLAAKAAQDILAARLAGAKSDPLIDAAISQIGAKLN